LYYDAYDDAYHSIFAKISGFSFTFLAIATGFINKGKKRIIAITVGILATLLSILMFEVGTSMGIWQRIIFVMCFGWMIFEFREQ